MNNEIKQFHWLFFPGFVLLVGMYVMILTHDTRTSTFLALAFMGFAACTVAFVRYAIADRRRRK
jgi:hypothetical protein